MSIFSKGGTWKHFLNDGPKATKIGSISSLDVGYPWSPWLIVTENKLMVK